MFIEDDDDVARRMGGRITDQQRTARSAASTPRPITLMSLFEYMIGNTDMSMFRQHNIRLVQTPASVRYPVPYDFDYSGLVNTRATPSPDKQFGIAVGSRSALPRAVQDRRGAGAVLRQDARRQARHHGAVRARCPA